MDECPLVINRMPTAKGKVGEISGKIQETSFFLKVGEKSGNLQIGHGNLKYQESQEKVRKFKIFDGK